MDTISTTNDAFTLRLHTNVWGNNLPAVSGTIDGVYASAYMDSNCRQTEWSVVWQQGFQNGESFFETKEAARKEFAAWIAAMDR